MDGHVLVHRHVHQHQPLREDEPVRYSCNNTDNDILVQFIGCGVSRWHLALAVDSNNLTSQTICYFIDSILQQWMRMQEPYRRSSRDISFPGPVVETCGLTSHTWQCSGYDRYRHEDGAEEGKKRKRLKKPNISKYVFWFFLCNKKDRAREMYLNSDIWQQDWTCPCYE